MQLIKSLKQYRVSFIFTKSQLGLLGRCSISYAPVSYYTDQEGIVGDGAYSLPEVAQLCISLDVD